MLVEMKSPVFIEKGQLRPPIVFKDGLNVVLGKENGENSIGKSSALLAIDFVFGGKTYLDSDGVKHMGDHTIFFTFKFDGQEHSFARNTGDAEKVYCCTRAYDLTGDVWTRSKFVDWLKEKYKIDFMGLSFRTTMTGFFRIYGKDNLDERHPLKAFQAQNMQKSIDMLVKLFDRYKDIDGLTKDLSEADEKLAAYRQARKFRFVSDLVGGTPKYEENIALIKSLQMELDNLTEDQVQEYSETDIEKNQKKSQLQADVLQLQTEIQTYQRRLKLLDMSIEYGLSPTEADLQELQEFFPQVNLRKIYEIERYHKKLAKILQGQFAEEKNVIETEIDSLNLKIQEIQKQITELGFVGSFSKEFLDKHSEIKGKIDALKTQNEAYLMLTDLQDAKKRADEILKSSMEVILRDIEQEINDRMEEFNASLFAESRKAPHLTINGYNSYKFETPDDTGTGSNYKGLVIYDLAVLYSTALPAIVHDSLILKNISDVAIAGIMRLYSQSKKQVFIAFDKQDAYGTETQKILLDNSVLKLSDGGCELYGESWNIERSKDEDELQETVETID